MGETRVPPDVLLKLKEADVRRLVSRRYFKKNILLGLTLTAGVVGIYAYSMLAVKQETFLDDAFDQKPSPVHQKKISGTN